MKPFFSDAAVVDALLVLELDEELRASVLGLHVQQEAERVAKESVATQLQLEHDDAISVVEYLTHELLVFGQSFRKLCSLRQVGGRAGREVVVAAPRRELTA